MVLILLKVYSSDDRKCFLKVITVFWILRIDFFHFFFLSADNPAAKKEVST
jgi:hypothetical protein